MAPALKGLLAAALDAARAPKPDAAALPEEDPKDDPKGAAAGCGAAELPKGAGAGAAVRGAAAAELPKGPLAGAAAWPKGAAACPKGVTVCPKG